ncbi:B-cell antigen receptor complex-associated protein beta chain isoform X1 [Loxodonta africana]|uniref:B-cell antigen receptor complex-associated protein beta chain isoform X1 n=1 Tax=Loxodonta africana TaxID=9785 RepID=UPI00054055DE|nr:B-cell antigen receptor complex-associated protein beta chain isoform X1 [Loxodonta africana]XP_049717188.1 B-cell antigen receptor complex-associated protein beta chain isoform X1 [Elephas maximus indicus]
MAGLVLPPVPSNWLVLLLLLLSAGEMVPTAKTEDVYPDSSGRACSKVWQNPRFVARKRGSLVEVKCYTDGKGTVRWFRKREKDQELQELHQGQNHILQKNSSVFTLTIRDIQFEDNGIYYCHWECPNEPAVRGCGTELRVMGFSSLAQLKRRNTLKDGIIMIQTLLIILFIIVPIFLLLDKDDSKAGMEEDHTYEGLNIDQTATYEDIVTLRTGEVKWSVGEHPGQE